MSLSHNKHNSVTCRSSWLSTTKQCINLTSICFRMQNSINRLARLLKPGGALLLRDYGRYDMAQLRFKKGRCYILVKSQLCFKIISQRRFSDWCRLSWVAFKTLAQMQEVGLIVMGEEPPKCQYCSIPLLQNIIWSALFLMEWDHDFYQDKPWRTFLSSKV